MTRESTTTTLDRDPPPPVGTRETWYRLAWDVETRPGGPPWAVRTNMRVEARVWTRVATNGGGWESQGVNRPACFTSDLSARDNGWYRSAEECVRVEIEDAERGVREAIEWRDAIRGLAVAGTAGAQS